MGTEQFHKVKLRIKIPRERTLAIIAERCSGVNVSAIEKALRIWLGVARRAPDNRGLIPWLRHEYQNPQG